MVYDDGTRSDNANATNYKSRLCTGKTTKCKAKFEAAGNTTEHNSNLAVREVNSQRSQIVSGIGITR